MKVVCSQNALNLKLSLLSRVAPTNPSHPILANILLEAEGDRLGLSVFDLSLGMQVWIPAAVKVPGTITVSAKLLNEMVSRLPNQDVEITAEDTRVILDYGSGFYQLQGISSEEFPALPSLDEVEPLTLTANTLREGLQSSLFASSTDESKQVLTGLHLSFQPDSLEFAATDGHRLAVATANQPITQSPPPITIPAKSLRDLERLIAKQDVELLLRCDPTQIIFDIPNEGRLTTRLLEGNYPEYHKLIPKEFLRQVTLERQLFIAALERVAVLAAQKNNVVKISIDTDQQQLKLEAEAPQLGSGEEHVAAQISGESLEVAFNVKYLLDGLKVMSTNDIQIQLTSETRPTIISPLGGMDMTYLVMPIQIR
ncbi:DNA polymerase III subunit beta [Candidatus Synechococcus calcipolaris G9]|uniref:Beta sliding clamp n=1 Tax=Candidatus Synechococcus calcipolaris G9 TaxID=1497997 RepID=A0ABT6EYV0_9SYNE|nr:DNA polymerase III subunit beta [Candidatus Synechococcus calcipolaris]MDG2990546.1 DNA polymerase III subunit beta [Candidatus Synechococcus calcipolaris G9]